MGRSPRNNKNTDRVDALLTLLTQAAGQELFQPFAFRSGKDFGRRSFLFDSPLVKEDDMIGNVPCKAHLGRSQLPGGDLR